MTTTAETFSGSSPRPWGTPPVLHGSWSWTPVHPHARGERLRRERLDCRADGSSPRPWGTRRHAHPGPGTGRFIPTPVGNAPAHSTTPRVPSVHPHARGERPSCRIAGISPAGSSPRPWGTRSGHGQLRPARRFIPTPVGNAPGSDRVATEGSVHPHARGERVGVAARIIRDRGSSPRPWGTPTDHGPVRPGPAVHPHARGERR